MVKVSLQVGVRVRATTVCVEAAASRTTLSRSSSSGLTCA